MADVSDNEELIATRKLHGLDDGLFEEDRDVEVGEYGRTNYGKIIKFAWLEHSNGKRDGSKVILINEDTLSDDFYYFSIGEAIVKHSKQIIDLIEVGDIVNGMEVLDIKKIVKDIESFKTIYSKEKISICVFISEAGAYYIDVKDTDIKTILTKESYMANCYKVGGLYGRNQ